MKVKELKNLLDNLPEDYQDVDVVFRVESSFHGLTDIDYSVRETNGDRIVLAKDC